MKKFRFLPLALLSATLIFSACSNDDDNDNGTSIPEDQQVKILVVNEGSFQSGNSTISAIMADNSVNTDIYYSINNSRLGDTGQGIYMLGGNYYVTVSGSKKIEVLDGDTFEREEVIEYNSFSPYSICVLNASEKTAAVSDPVNNKIYVLDYDENKITIATNFGAPTYDMTSARGQILVTTSEWGDDGFVNKLYQNTITNISNSFVEIEDVSPMDRAHLVVDGEYFVWAYTNEGLVRINPVTREVERTLYFNEIDEGQYQASAYSARLAISTTGDRLYFNVEQTTDSGTTRTFICNVSPYEPNFDNSGIFEVSGLNTLYNLAYSPYSNTIFITDTDYVNSGKVIEYSLQGSKLNTYTVGVNPFYLFFIR
ncbi:MAG: hypothetical protein LUF90_07195 [Rikenellaceae bacterium]|nr:hypothetical protein [Rikenellaceae bacterium]